MIVDRLNDNNDETFTVDVNCSRTVPRINNSFSSNSVSLAQTRVYVLRHAATIMYTPALTGVLLIVPFLSLPPLFGTVCLAISVAHLLSHLS